MTLQLDALNFHGAKASRGPGFTPNLVDQVVAGLLWMALDLPDDVSRQEVEMLAHRLVTRIRARAERDELEHDLASLQLDQFSRPPSFPAIREVIGRAMSAVHGF